MFRDKRNFACRGTEITQQMEIGLQKSVRPRQASVDLDRLMERYQQAGPASAHALVVTPLCLGGGVAEDLLSLHPTSRSRTTTDGPRAGDGWGPWRSRSR
jgi:hypothetical protein